MSDTDLNCRFCDRPCANGTGRAAHERHCPARASAAICKACHQDYPRGTLEQHLKTCPASATAELGWKKPVRAAREHLDPGDLVISITITGNPTRLEQVLTMLGVVLRP